MTLGHVALLWLIVSVLQVLHDIAAECGGVIISFPRGTGPSERVVVKGAKDCVELAKQRIAEEVENLVRLTALALYVHSGIPSAGCKHSSGI